VSDWHTPIIRRRSGTSSPTNFLARQTMAALQLSDKFDTYLQTFVARVLEQIALSL
jgi:hypothetical protein